MRLKALLCDVLSRYAYQWAAVSPHILDIETFSADAYHDYPEQAHNLLQAKIDELQTDKVRYDAILLGYGLCGKVMEGIQSGSIPLVVPRVHDCITLFLGSQAKYNRIWGKHPGTLCYIDAWLERSPSRLETNELQSVGFRASFEEYVEKYGEEDARYLFEMATSWQAHYDQCLYIKNAFIGDDFSAEVKAKADTRNWTYTEVEGDTGLIKKLLLGDWNDQEFLRVDRDMEIYQSGDEQVMRCRNRRTS